MTDEPTSPDRHDSIQDLDVPAEHAEDVKGGLLPANQIVSPRDPASGLPTGKRNFIGETEKN